MKRVLSTLLAFILLFTLVSCGTPAADTPDDADPIILGSIQDISNETSVYGRMISEGIRWRVEVINKGGGINGRQIELIEYDSKASVDESINAYHRLVEAGAVLIFCPHQANIGIALAPVAQETKVPVVTFGMDNRVTRQGDDGTGAPWDYMFLIQPSCELQATIMARYTVEELGYKRISALYREDNSYSVSLFDAFKTFCEANGAEIVATETFKTGDMDYKTMLTKLLAADPDCLYIPNYISEIVPIVQQARGLGYEGDIIESLDAAPPFASLCGPEADNVYFISNIRFDDPAVLGVIDEYVAAGNKEPDEIIKFCVSYDMMGAVASVIEAVGTDREAIRDGMENLTGYEGLSGTISIDPVTHQPYGLGMNIYVIENGESKFLKYYLAE